MRRHTLILALLCTLTLSAQRLTIVHTNDTHSHIEADERGRGGIQGRKHLIDSIRRADAHVLLVDAGDAVQGSMYFTLYGGTPEQQLMNALGYDLRILGNHEFDNGLQAMAANMALSDAQWLSTNYDLRDTPTADIPLSPFALRRYGDKTIAFLGLNIDPTGLIDPANSAGVHYSDPIAAAAVTALYLKEQGADRIVALTHLGYDDDRRLAASSRDIDLIIGGHSHTVVNPGVDTTRVANLLGRRIPVLQTGNNGRYLGVVTLDLDADTVGARLIPVLEPETKDAAIEAIIAPYRHGVDSVAAIPVGRSEGALAADSPALLNWVSDRVLDLGKHLSGLPVDLAIMNKGGIRNPMPEGTVTRRHIMEMLPFDNYVVVLELPGQALLNNLRVMASQGGNGLSRGMEVVYNPATNEVVEATLDGTPIDPERTYRVATISYLANGGDDMTPLTGRTERARSPRPLYDDIIAMMSLSSQAVRGDATPRMRPL